MANRWGNNGNRGFIFGGSKITADVDCIWVIKRHLLLGRKAMTNLDSILKSRDIALPTKIHQSYGFSSSHVWMWELDYKESWVPKKWCFWTVVLERLLRVPWTAACHASLSSTNSQLKFEIVQTHDDQVGDAIQPYHPVSSPSPPAFNLSQHKGLF